MKVQPRTRPCPICKELVTSAHYPCPMYVTPTVNVADGFLTRMFGKDAVQQTHTPPLQVTKSSEIV